MRNWKPQTPLFSPNQKILYSAHFTPVPPWYQSPSLSSKGSFFSVRKRCFPHCQVMPCNDSILICQTLNLLSASLKPYVDENSIPGEDRKKNSVGLRPCGGNRRGSTPLRVPTVLVGIQCPSPLNHHLKAFQGQKHRHLSQRPHV